MPKKDLLYPYFDKCAKCAPSGYVEIFKSLAYGTAPRYLYIHDGSISTQNNRRASIRFEGEPIDVFVPACVQFIQTYSTVHLEETQHKAMRAINEIYDAVPGLDLKQCEWTNIRSKATRKILILDYVVRMKREHKLSASSEHTLYTFITNGMLVKDITSTDVVFVNGRVESIANLEINGDCFSISSKTDEAQLVLCEPAYTHLETEWNKFMDSKGFTNSTTCATSLSEE